MYTLIPRVLGKIAKNAGPILEKISENWKKYLVGIGVLSAAGFSFSASLGAAFETVRKFEWILISILLVVMSIASIRVYFYYIDQKKKRE